MADNNLDQKIQDAQSNLDTLTSELTKRAEKLFGQTKITTGDLKEFTKQLREQKKGIQEDIKSKQLQAKIVQQVVKEEQKRIEILKKQNEEAKKPGFWQKVLGTANKENSFEQMYRVRQRFGGVEQMLSGNIGSGLSQFLGSFQLISKIMGGPLFLAIQTVVTGLLKFDSALAKASTTASSITGGMNSEYVGRGLASMSYNAGLKENLYAIGMQGKRDELISALQKGYGYGSYRGQQADFLTSMAYAQKGLSSLGISAETSNSLLERLRLIEGKDTTGIYAQLQRFQNASTGKNAMRYFSPEQAMNQMMTLADQTKGLGTNFEWASRIVQRFEKGLKDGTVALSDFAAVNRSMRGGGISGNAGIAALVSDYALRNGMQLPSGFTNSNIIGQSFAVSTQAMLTNNQFARAYQGQLQETLDEIGGNTKEERAGALQLLLQSRNINISPELASKAIKSDGTIDLIGTGIIGSKMGERQKIEEEKSKQYQSLVEAYYKGTTSWHDKILTKLDKVISNTGSSMAEGFEGNIDPNASGFKAFGQFIGYSLSTGIWEGFGDMFEKIGKRSAQLPPSMQ